MRGDDKLGEQRVELGHPADGAAGVAGAAQRLDADQQHQRPLRGDPGAECRVDRAYLRAEIAQVKIRLALEQLLDLRKLQLAEMIEYGRFGGKMEKKGAFRDARCRANRVDRRLVIAVLEKKRDGGLEDSLLRRRTLLLPALQILPPKLRSLTTVIILYCVVRASSILTTVCERGIL